MIIANIVDHGVIYAFTGAFAGLMSGILGIGGGVIIVPALAYIFKHKPDFPSELSMHFAAGTSLAIMIVSSQLSLRAHHKKMTILWPVYRRLWPGIMIGTVIGALLADLLPSQILKLLFGLFLLLLCMKMYFDRKVAHVAHTPSPMLNFTVTALSGLASGLLGIGGGVLVIPYLTYCGIQIRQVAALSALCTMTVALVGAAAYIFTGMSESALPRGATGYIFWPAVFWVALPTAFFAPIGVNMTYKLPEKQLRTGFIVFLLIVALDMLLD